jgi:hypothetical protein
MYSILKIIFDFFKNYGDYAMRGTICYVFAFISTNSELKQDIENLNWQFFFNSDICFPKADYSYLFLDINEKFENTKIYENLNKLNKVLILSDVK